MFNGKPASKWVILLFSSFRWEKAASGNHILLTLHLCLTVSQPPRLVPQPQAQYRNEQREYCWLWTRKLSGQFSGVPVGVIKMSPSPSLSPSSLLCPRLTHNAEVPAHSQDIPFSLEEAYETVYYPLWLKKIALRSITPRTVQNRFACNELGNETWVIEYQWKNQSPVATDGAACRVWTV